MMDCPVDEAAGMRFNPQAAEFSAIFKGLRTPFEKVDNPDRRGPSLVAAATSARNVHRN
jgi:hypothetical protein